MKKLIIITLLLLYFGANTPVFSQSKQFELKINLTHIKEGYAKLLIEGISLDIDHAHKWLIKDGKVIITGTLPEAHPYLGWIRLNDSVATGNFIVSPGQNQMIQLHDDIFGAFPTMEGNLMKENKLLKEKLAAIDENQTAPYYAQKSKMIKDTYHGKPPQNVLDSFNVLLDKISFSKDSVISDFIIQNPDSYVGLLYLYDRGHIRGYSKELNNALSGLNVHIQSSDIGQKTKQIFEDSKRTAIGQLFPPLGLLDLNNNPVSYKITPATKGKKRLILIDFWYSNCGPCIAQFDLLKDMYKKYHEKGFDIVSISTDSDKKIQSWKNVISRYDLPWVQYLDLNGKKAESLNINSYPFNFLIDDQGNILQKHLPMVNLQEILDNNLNS